MDVDGEECTVVESIRQIVEHGLQSGKFDDPRLTQQLIKSMRKKEKAAKIRKERIKQAYSSSSGSESSEDTVPIRLYTGNTVFNPTVLSSEIKNVYEDDTPVYEEVISSLEEEETSDERELIRCMAEVCLKISEDEKKEALDEIKRELDAMGVGRDRLFNLAWRSMFIMTNTNDTLDESDLTHFLDQYCLTETQK